MKKIVCLIICVTVLLTVLTSCRKSTYYLNDSQIDELYKDENSAVSVIHPFTDDIIGVYKLSGTDPTSDETEWDGYFTDYNGKIVLQILTPDKEFQSLDDEMIDGIISSYDAQEGSFEQKYVTDGYVSTYQATLFIEDGITKINVIYNFMYTDDNVVRNGLSANGYKTEVR